MEQFHGRCQAVLERLMSGLPPRIGETVKLSSVGASATGAAFGQVVVGRELEGCEDDAIAFAMAFALATDVFRRLADESSRALPVEKVDAVASGLPDWAQVGVGVGLGGASAAAGTLKVSGDMLFRIGEVEREAMVQALSWMRAAGYSEGGAIGFYEHRQAPQRQRQVVPLKGAARALVAGLKVMSAVTSPFRRGEAVFESDEARIEFVREWARQHTSG